MPTPLSPHFTLEELTVTDTGLPNVPNNDQRTRLAYLANYALERVRGNLGVAIKINSAFRSYQVNAAVGGSKTSAHLRGDAADMVPVGMDLTQAYHMIFEDPGLDFDQLIWEAHGVRGGVTRWIHLGLAAPGQTPRHQKLIYSPKTNGQYLPFDDKLTV